MNDVRLFNFVFLALKRWFQFNLRIVITDFESVMTLNNWEMIAETRSYSFRSRSRCRLCFTLPNRTEWSTVPRVTPELYDTKSYYQLIVSMTVRETL